VEVLCLFLIVLTHEFGHQLACRQVGGRTSDIVLWPLGGVAYVQPPQRAGAQLWSIAAGPLVNVILIPVLSVLVSVSGHLGWFDTQPDAYQFVHDIWIINFALLIFNLLPIYPLDGGQILRSLLWFPFGRANSLMVASIIGFLGVAGLIGVSIWLQSYWLGLMSAFILMNCWGGFKQARALSARSNLPRREGLACPACHLAPIQGELWRCGQCGNAFDIFASHGLCPQCGTQFNATQCLECGNTNPIAAWSLPPVVDI
jgi:Zn-dependent protease